MKAEAANQIIKAIEAEAQQTGFSCVDAAGYFVSAKRRGRALDWFTARDNATPRASSRGTALRVLIECGNG